MSDKVMREVANPEHEQLGELLRRAEECASRVARVLDSPVRLMSSDGVWSAPTTATAFAQELEGRRRELPGRLEGFVAAVSERRNRVPSTVDVPAWEL